MSLETRKKVKHYTNGEITVVWKPELCMHASFCWKELPEVFNPQNRPWINIEGASSERIVYQVGRCPSGALSYFRNEDGEKPETPETSASDATVKVTPTHNGPLMIEGNFQLAGKDGKITPQKGPLFFCRCGGSKNMPFCDGTHEKINFKG